MIATIAASVIAIAAVLGLHKYSENPLKNMHTLCERINSALGIDSKTNTGSTVDAHKAIIKVLTTINAILDNLDEPASILREKSEVIKELSNKLTSDSQGLTSEIESAFAHSVEIREACNVNLDKIDTVKQLANQSNEMSAKYNASMDETLEIMATVEKKIAAINDIAYQTHLLSINAAIEARTAGDFGRGFSVVAKEVRALAEKATSAAAGINEIISRNKSLSVNTKAQFHELNELVSKNSALLFELNGISGGLSEKANIIMNLLENIAIHGVTNTEQASSLSKIASNIYHHSCELEQSASHFKTFNFISILKN